MIDNSLRFPNKPCLSFRKNYEWKSYNWNELKSKVAQSANALKESGVKPDDNVAIYSENIAEWIIFDLAIVSIGAVSVPIYATSTSPQAKYILDEAEVRVILAGSQIQYDNIISIYAESEFLETIIVADTDVKLVSEKSYHFNNWIQDQPIESEIEFRKQSDLATIIYTSGTTGEPKGVMLTHGNFLSAFEAHIDFFKFTNLENEHSLSFLPLSHVFERIWSVFMLYSGAQIYMSENPKMIAETLKQVRPTMMCSVPRLYQKIHSGIFDKINKESGIKQKIFHWAIRTGAAFAENRRKGIQNSSFSSFKYKLAEKLVFSKIKAQMGGRLWFMPVGGAAISADLTKFFESIGIHLTIGYGLTETTATVTCFPLTNYVYGTCGIPLTGTQYTLGPDDEILVKGPGVMKGYYKKPEATSEVFTSDGWFRTGDSGKIDPNGNLIIVDRLKDLMKTSTGKYITPQPIENLLTNDSFIQQAIIIGDEKPFVTALLVPDFEALKQFAEKAGIKFESLEELVRMDKIKEFYREKIDSLQKNLSSFEKIKNFKLLHGEFTMDLGEITPTLKIKRNIILKKFSDLIDDMYK